MTRRRWGESQADLGVDNHANHQAEYMIESGHDQSTLRARATRPSFLLESAEQFAPKVSALTGEFIPLFEFHMECFDCSSRTCAHTKFIFKLRQGLRARFMCALHLALHDPASEKRNVFLI